MGHLYQLDKGDASLSDFLSSQAAALFVVPGTDIRYIFSNRRMRTKAFKSGPNELMGFYCGRHTHMHTHAHIQDTHV